MSSMHTSQDSGLRIPSLFIDPLVRILLWVLLFISLLFGRTDLSALCLVMLLLSAGAKVWRRLVAGRLVCRFLTDKLRVMPGESLVFTAEAHNGFILPMTVRSRLAGAGRLSGDGYSGDLRECVLGGRRTGRLEWPMNAPGRGVYRIGPPVTEAGDALGLFFQETSRDAPLELIVYPNHFRIGSFSRQSKEFFGSIRAEGLIEDPINPMGTREYHPGRPAKAIHWKASARLNRLQEKVFEPSRRARILLSLDVKGFHETGDEEGFEEILETAASVAVHLVKNGVSVGMITNTKLKGDCSPVVPVSQGPTQLSVILELMARMTMEPGADLIKLAGYILPRTPGAGCLHCVRAPDEAAEAFGSYILDRKTPVSFLAARRGDGSALRSAVSSGLAFTETLRRSGGRAAA